MGVRCWLATHSFGLLHDLKLSFYGPIVVSPETIHQYHLVTH